MMILRVHFLVGFVIVVTACPPGLAEPNDVPAPSPSTAAMAAQAPAADPSIDSLPGIHIDREKGYIDLEAKVVLREGRWLELLACTPGSKEHESILTLVARPSHIHLALLILGLQPGQPMQWQWREEQFHVTPPTGPLVAITLHYTDDHGQRHEVPAHHWIRDQKADKPLVDNRWLFTGSRMEMLDDRPVYRADVNGAAISLVNFGDDLLSRSTTMTHQDDQATWAADTPAIPPVGTPVVVRLAPVTDKSSDGSVPR